MDRFFALKVFVDVAEAGSFSRASEKLEISVAAASRAVSQLEQHLGARLLHRNTRHLSLTEVGQQFLARAREILSSLMEAEAEAGIGSARPSGLLRVSLPVAFGVRYVAPAVAGFCRRYPDIRLELHFSDSVLDLVQEGFDVTLRISRNLPADVVARRLCPIRMATCAAPGYLRARGMLREIGDLSRHDCLTYSLSQDFDTWRFSFPGGPQTVPVRSVLCANNGEALAALAVAGMGIIHEPTFIVGDALRAGTLVPVLADDPASCLSLYAVYPSRRYLSARTRAFVDYFVDLFGEVPPWDRGLPLEPIESAATTGAA